MRPISALPILALVACGGVVDPYASGAYDDGGTDALAHARDGGNVGNGYHDPNCPDAGPPRVLKECDTADPINSCKNAGPNAGCYPFVMPPAAACESETYGTTCLPAGSGTQGVACGSGGSCAPGYVCLITGGDTQCAKLCNINAKQSCPPGFVCGPIDIPGFGACL
jgi:hypothetical protein